VPGEDRSQQATPKRKLKARESGQVVRSRELTSALSLLAIVLLLGFQSGVSVGPWRSLLGQMLAGARQGDRELAASIAPVLWRLLLRWLAAPFALLWSIAVASSIAQGGLVFAPAALEPKLERLNPARNIGHLFSMAGISRMLKSLIPVVAIAYIGFIIASRDWIAVVTSSRASISALLGWAFSRWYEIEWKCGMVLLAWAGVDYFFQKRNLDNSLKMTKEEVRQESKESEGNPQIRAQIRRRRREMRKRWSMKDVERATAVITNPTHFAVAIEYRPMTMAAPVVVAKGMNRIAERIKSAARWHGIPIVENPPLAQALYKATEVGEAIPAKLYAAVAEILAFLYRTQANLRNSIQSARAAAAGAAHGARN
jgi:flagellar biosynthetic protein FlhB